MLTLYKNRNIVTLTYSYDRDDERRDAEPNVIVDDRPAAADSQAVPFLLSSTPHLSYRDEGVVGDAASNVEYFLYEGTYFDVVADTDFGPCRCGGRHGEGRFLSHDPVGLFDGAPTVYRYVADAPPRPDDAS